MKDFKLIKVFLASPGDVLEEGKIVRETLDSINRTLGDEKEIQFRIINWKTDSFPSYGDDAQTIINEQIADMSNYDLFIGIMWNRFGTPTPRADSGTEEEFIRAVESLKNSGRPEIMFYFNQAPHSFNSLEETEQKMKVLKFKKELEKNGLPYSYNGIDEFKKDFRNHVESWLVKHSPQKLAPPHIESEVVQLVETKTQNNLIQTLSDSGMWVLLKTGFFLADEVSELSEGKISIKIPVSSADQDAHFRSLQPKSISRNEPIPFAHQNVGAIARVTEAKRTSANGKNIWELFLDLEMNNSGFLSEMAFNGISADQIAELRARFILLNENPQQNRKQAPQFNLNEGMVAALVKGLNSSVKVEGSVLPELWKNVGKDVDTFLPLARLWSVFHLITSNSCEHILELIIGPVADEKVHIKFRGQRHKQYVNADPYIIKFEGFCDLNSK